MYMLAKQNETNTKDENEEDEDENDNKKDENENEDEEYDDNEENESENEENENPLSNEHIEKNTIKIRSKHIPIYINNNTNEAFFKVQKNGRHNTRSIIDLLDLDDDEEKSFR